METKDNVEVESSFFFFLRLIISNWKLLFFTYLTVGILTVVILLLLPKWYKSEATIVILEDNSSPLSGVLSQFSSFGFGLSGGTNVETYIEYIHTAKMYDRLINHFNLKEVYKTEAKEDTYDKIFSSLAISDNENRTFTISFAFEEDPLMPKEIVEFIFQELDKITLEVDKAQASNFKVYLEDYYLNTKNKLRADEDSLIRFQKKTGILDLSTQVQATLTGIADLEKQKISLEIEKRFIQKSLANSSASTEIDNKIQSINEQLEALNSDNYTALVSLEKAPDKGANFLRLARDIEVGSQVAEFLRLQYEQAVLDEQKINSDLYLLDPPQVAEKRFKPARSRILFVTMFFTVLISLLLIRVKEYYKVNKSSFMELIG